MKRLAAIALVLLALPSVASAESFSAKFVGTGFGASVSGVSNGVAFSGFAGQINWQAPNLDELLTTFCVDIEHYLTQSQTFTERATEMSSVAAVKISYLVATNFGNITSGILGAGLQLAIWNVLYDSDYSVTEQSMFYTTSNEQASKAANGFLQNLKYAAPTSLTANVRFLDVDSKNRGGQDQVTYSTPEPGTLLLLGAGALALAARRRFTRRAN